MSVLLSNTGIGRLFCKGPDSKCCRLCWPYGLCHCQALCCHISVTGVPVKLDFKSRWLAWALVFRPWPNPQLSATVSAWSKSSLKFPASRAHTQCLAQSRRSVNVETKGESAPVPALAVCSSGPSSQRMIPCLNWLEPAPLQLLSPSHPHGLMSAGGWEGLEVLVCR